MFVLDVKQIGGYSFGQRTWYGVKHLGVDYKANGSNLYAPCDGTILRQFYGFEGGNTIWFQPDNEAFGIRMMHLKRFTRGIGRVSKGELIGITGNTGYLTTGPHLHLDITTTFSGSFWTNFSNFIDPESINWETIGQAKIVEPQPEPKSEVVIVLVVTAPSEFPRQFTATAKVYVRTEPRGDAPLGGSRFLSPGDVFTGVDRTAGTDPYGDGRNTWIKSSKGNYVWEGALK